MHFSFGPAPCAAAAVLLGFACSGGPAAAQNITPAPGALSGFKAIATECIILTPEPYAPAMCKHVVTSAKKQAVKAGLKHEHLGSQDWISADTDGRRHRDPQDTASDNPLRATFFIRGTAGREAGAYIRLTIWVPADNGKLVLWERSTLGAGPRKKLGPAVSKVTAKRMGAFFKLLEVDNN